MHFLFQFVICVFPFHFPSYFLFSRWFLTTCQLTLGAYKTIASNYEGECGITFISNQICGQLLTVVFWISGLPTLMHFYLLPVPFISPLVSIFSIFLCVFPAHFYLAPSAKPWSSQFYLLSESIPNTFTSPSLSLQLIPHFPASFSTAFSSSCSPFALLPVSLLQLLQSVY